MPKPLKVASEQDFEESYNSQASDNPSLGSVKIECGSSSGEQLKSPVRITVLTSHTYKAITLQVLQKIAQLRFQHLLHSEYIR